MIGARTAWCDQEESAAASVDQSSQILTTAVRDPLRLVLEYENKVNVPKRATHIWLIFWGVQRWGFFISMGKKAPHNHMIGNKVVWLMFSLVKLWCPCFFVSITKHSRTYFWPFLSNVRNVCSNMLPDMKTFYKKLVTPVCDSDNKCWICWASLNVWRSKNLQ